MEIVPHTKAMKKLYTEECSRITTPAVSQDTTQKLDYVSKLQGK